MRSLIYFILVVLVTSCNDTKEKIDDKYLNAANKAELIRSANILLNDIDSLFKVNHFESDKLERTLFSPISESDLIFYAKNRPTSINWNGCNKVFSENEKIVITQTIRNIVDDTSFFLVRENINQSKVINDEVQKCYGNISIMPRINSTLKETKDSIAYYLKFPYTCADAIADEIIFFENKSFLIMVELDRHNSIPISNQLSGVIKSYFTNF